MAVGEFGRETDVVRHDRVDACLVGAVGGGGGENDLETSLRQEGVPEGVVLVHVEDTGYADASAGPAGQGLSKRSAFFSADTLRPFAAPVPRLEKTFSHLLPE